MRMVIVLFSLLWGYSARAFLSAEAIQACLKEDFSVAISHAVFPLGYFFKELTLAKRQCEISINYKAYRWIKSGWLIDVCREPLHIKSGIKSFKIIKKDKACPDENSLYCREFQKIAILIEDDGLIFAKGEKENFSSEHGKLYCLYVLINKYLSGEEVLSRYHPPKPYRYTEGIIKDHHLERDLDKKTSESKREHKKDKEEGGRKQKEKDPMPAPFHPKGSDKI